MADVLAAVNIARRAGEVTGSREIEPTPGELQRIKDRSRQASEDDRTIDEALARRVAAGELTVGEALAAHRERDSDDSP
jgi:transposase